MTSPFSGLPLAYRIGQDEHPQGEPGVVTEVGYGQRPVAQGFSVAYANLRVEEGGRVPEYEPYIDPPDDIEKKYGEPRPDPNGPGFKKNIIEQLDRAKALGHTHVEQDNPDSYKTGPVTQALDWAQERGLRAVAKNAKLMGVGDLAYVKHPIVDGIIVENGAGEPEEYDRLRTLAGKQDLPVWFVFYDDAEDGRGEAVRFTDVILARGYKNMGVTYDSKGEYGGTIQDVLLPVPAQQQPEPPMPPAVDVTPWVQDEEADARINRYDDEDAPALGNQVARAFPDDQKIASYVTAFGPSTAWCGIYQANKLSKYGTKPPMGPRDVDCFAWVDAWKPFGTGVSAAQLRPGDLGIWINEHGLHHIAMYDGDGYWIGGNQSNTVSRIKIATPSVLRRPPPPNSATMPPDQARPMIMRNSTGPDVVYAQTLLMQKGFDVGPDGADGDFGPNTEAAVIAYQTAHNLEVDGIIGDETWGSLLSGAQPAPPTTVPGQLSQELITKVLAVAVASPIAKYSWKDRGVAPIGYTGGMAVTFAKVYLDFLAGRSNALAMTRPLGPKDKDAIALYGQFPTLPVVFGFLLGLGMRESSGKYNEGRDTSAGNVSSDEAEAGLFQQSWNSHAASPEIDKAFAMYSQANAIGFREVFAQGVGNVISESWGSGTGYQFQVLCKTKPAFAVEAAAIGIRVLCKHWGPIIREEVELKQDAIALFYAVKAVVDEAQQTQPTPKPPEPPTPEPPPIDGEIIPPVGSPNQLTILALLVLILLKERDHTMPPQIDTNALLAEIGRMLAATAPAALPPPASSSAATPDPVAKAINDLLVAAGRAPAALPPPAAVPAPATVQVAPVPPAEVPAGTASLSNTSVKLSAWTFAIGALAQMLGYVGTPGGMGTTPTTAGTITTAAPILAALVGGLGGFGWVIPVFQGIVGALGYSKKS